MTIQANTGKPVLLQLFVRQSVRVPQEESIEGVKDSLGIVVNTTTHDIAGSSKGGSIVFLHHIRVGIAKGGAIIGMISKRVGFPSWHAS